MTIPSAADHPTSFPSRLNLRRHTEFREGLRDTLSIGSVVHMFFKCDEMNWSSAFTLKTLLIFLKYHDKYICTSFKTCQKRLPAEFNEFI